MNAQISLSFRDVNFDITDIHGQPWLRSFQIGSALGYKNPSSDMAKLYDRNADEFTDSMTQVIELPTAGGKQQVRVFSLRGCHLLGMLARTKVAKEFRRWVLDVLEKEVSGSQPKLAKTTVADRTPLRQAVSALVGKCNIDYSSAYSMVHQRFGVDSIEDIPAERLNDAVQYVHALTLYSGLNGEVLDALPPQMQGGGILLSDHEISRFATVTYFLDWATRQLYDLSEPLKQLGARDKGVAAYTLRMESHSWLKHCRETLQRVQPEMRDAYFREHVAGSLRRMDALMLN
ncbi:Bro-N domain-containing protein [Kingella bonacorsii]|uniref:Bro-N domain-containing protein n=1 Tax=Kingella bonacorsii TaxID=2796361 RepID=A0ABS1BVD1_9NEIS|nr:Bro-N domain-containing protein [Kingella bonacorsii]MBK0397262.1 Bro-N domain-containing protein [Kingella bonacorsii]